MILNAPALVGILAAWEVRAGAPKSLPAPNAEFTRADSAVVRAWIGLLLVQMLLIEILAETRW